MMGRIKTAMQCGFLVMVFFASGISALRCHSASSIVQNGSRVEIPTEVSIGHKIITCSKGQNACVEAQVTLSIDQMFLLVTHRGCADKELDGAGSNSSGDLHFIVKSNVRYCFRDLCNQEMGKDAPWSPGEDTVPEESGSTQCYSGLMLDPTESLWGVTCRRGYSQCYHGYGIIQTGPLAMSVLIKTCQRPPCAIPMSQSFGPIEIRQWGSCCVGSYCNGMETAPKIQNTMGNHSKVFDSPVTSFTKPDTEKGMEGKPPGSATGAHLPGHPFKLIMTTPDPVYENATDYYDYDYYYDQAAEAVRFQSGPFCPLLIVLGITVFGARW